MPSHRASPQQLRIHYHQSGLRGQRRLSVSHRRSRAFLGEYAEVMTVKMARDTNVKNFIFDDFLEDNESLEDGWYQ